ncbi:MAG TPA: CoA-binding protein, partial [Sneathiellales bacterium]|nr:CoA-binding protein [Sneathiellales bacterium]
MTSFPGLSKPCLVVADQVMTSRPSGTVRCRMSGADEEAVTRAQPLLHPASMAVIGASARPGRPGHAAISAARLYGFTGPLYPVTPRYDEIDGLVCYTDIADVPGPVDLAVIAGAAGRAPGFLEQSIAAGVRGAIIFATLSREKDGGMSPVERVTGMAREAGVPLLGPGSIGYVNYSASLAGTWIPPEPGYAKAGTIALIMQSGSLYAYCGHTDPRLRPCFIAHPGQEADFGTAEILNYALSLPETRVVGLYLETVRDPALFAQCLERADQKNVPIVVFKPGRSARSAQAITTHAGRLAGDDRIFDALFRRYHVARTDTMDEFYATLLMFSKMDVPGPGGLAAVKDSGGQRSVLLDEADRIGLPLAQFSDRTRGRLREVLAPDLPDDNPVDIWGGEENLVEHIEACIEIALDDPDTALTAVFTELGAADGDVFVHSSTSAGINVARVAEKPVLAMTFSSRHFHPNNILKLDDAGLVVLEGVRTGLAAIKHLLDRRERKSGATPDVVGLPYGAPSLVNA